jgi:hypothetical protein
MNGGNVLQGLLVDQNATLNISQTASSIGDQLSNSGTINISESTDLNFRNGAGITNSPSGTITLHASGVAITRNGGSTALFSNAGLVQMTAAGTLSCQLPFINYGSAALLTVHSGTLSFTTADSQHNVSVYQGSGRVNLDSGAFLRVSFGYTQDGGTLQTTGNSVASLDDGDVTINAGSVNPANQKATYGQLAMNRSFHMNGGTLTIVIAAPSGPNDQLAANAIFLGGTSVLNVVTNNPPPVNGQTFDVLTTVTTITGDFSDKHLTYQGGHYTSTVLQGVGYRLTAVNTSHSTPNARANGGVHSSDRAGSAIDHVAWLEHAGHRAQPDWLASRLPC